MTPEQLELMRQAGQRVLDMQREGRRFDDDVLGWARRQASRQPLGGPVSTGERIEPPTGEQQHGQQ